MSAIVVKQTRSGIGQSKNQRLILRALGLRKIGATNKLKDNNCIRGMVNKVKHLVEYELVND
jgi:large subunit ribosomal protein L30